MYCWATPLSIIWKDWVLHNNAFMPNLRWCNNKMYLDLHVKCLTFLPDSIQIWTFMTDFHKSPPYQMSWNLCSAAGVAIHICRRIGEKDMTRHDKANGCISWLCEWAEQAHKNTKHCKAHSYLAVHPLCCGSCDCMWVSLLHWAAVGPDQILSHCGYRVCLQAALCHLLQLSWQSMTVHELTSPDPPVLGHPPGCGSCQRVVVHAVRKYDTSISNSRKDQRNSKPFPIHCIKKKKLSLVGICTKIRKKKNEFLSRIHKEYSHPLH